MAEYYFYNGLLEIGKKFSLKSKDIKKIRANHKPQLLQKIYFQDKNNRLFLGKIIQIKTNFLQFFVLAEKKILAQSSFLELYLPIIANKELEQLLFYATELGVASFCFFESEYSKKIIPSIIKKKNLWEKILKEACENSGNFYLPKINFCGSLKKILLDLEKNRDPFFILHPQQKAMILTHQQQNLFYQKNLKVFVGPKRGFSNEELKNLTCPILSFGTNLLKPQTAALSILAIFQYFQQKKIKINS